MIAADLANLFDDGPPPERWVEGRWAPVRFHLNLHTGEFLNIGVIFKAKRARKPCFRLTSTLRPIEYLLGEKARDNLAFLMALIAEQFQKGADRMPSPQVSLGDWQFAQGESEELVCEQLFASAVTFGRAPESTKVAVPKTERYTYEETAKAVFKSLWETYPDVAKTLEQKKPITARGRNDKEIKIRLPLRGPNRFGAFGSAWYKDDQYRQANIDHPCMTLIAASAHVDAGERGSFFVWRPEESLDYGRELQNKIDSELDVAFHNLKSHNIELIVESTPKSLAKSIRSWATN